jgi:hypothetical protein
MGPVKDAMSKTFIAFDLLETKMIVKYHFMPTFKLSLMGCSNLETTEKAIEGLLSLPPSFLSVLFSLVANYNRSFYTTDQQTVEILAFGYVNPGQFRTKIYLRSQHTSFNSVIDILTLGGNFHLCQKTNMRHFMSCRTWSLTLIEELANHGHFYIPVSSGLTL